MVGTLKDDQVRLVSVLDEGNENGRPMLVTRRHIHNLHHHNSPFKSSYIALSYVWGNDRGNLVCDDHELEVSSALIPALRQLRAHYPDKLFWTDSISIDQHDAGEKAHQVGMMGRIFASAELVAIWLGEGLEDVFYSLQDTSLFAQQGKSDARIQLLQRVANLAWFYRAWTFQEIRLARKAVVMLGQQHMPWTDFIEKIQALQAKEPHLSTVTIRSQPRSYSAFPYEPKDQFFSIADHLNSGTSADLAELLYVTWYRESTIKHDKVYSLLSSELFNNSRHGIGIDYSLPWSSICIKTARACINTASDLKILKIAGMKQRWKSPTTNQWDSNELNQLLNHPSWAPNWWEPPQQMRSVDTFAYDQRGCFSALNFCCPETPPVQSVHETSPFLILKGVILGVVNIGDPPSYRGGPPLVHAPPHCAQGQPHEWFNNPEKGAVDSICKVYIPKFVDEVQNHLNGHCPCVPYHQRSNPSRPHGMPAHPPWEKQPLGFTNTHFPIVHRAHEAETTNPNNPPPTPPQILATSIESGDYLVLLEGSGVPFLLRPVIDRTGRATRPETLMTPTERAELDVPDDAGCFVLVGEASMCWDQLWPGLWDVYCRAGSFVVV